MEKYFSKKRRAESAEGSSVQQSSIVHQPCSSVTPLRQINLDELPVDPANRKNIFEFDADLREMVRLHYLKKGPYQPRSYKFPFTHCGDKKRRFVPSWFDEHRSWLEYSISKDAAFCLCCYLFKPQHGFQEGGDIFVADGFRNWKKALERFKKHVGNHNSVHSKCLKACEDLMSQNQQIEVYLESHARLVASVNCIKFILCQGWVFCGYNVSDESNNKGNFLELLLFMADLNEDIKNVVLQSAPENLNLVAPSIHKDIVNAAAVETINVIFEDIKDDLFSIFVDEAYDISLKEHMAIVLRYVDKRGCVIERFIGFVHVNDTTPSSLKVVVKEMLAKYGLSMSHLRGQGYDGARNMEGQFNGLKSLIMAENPCAYYIHCFAHPLQLTLVAITQKDRRIASFFRLVSILANVVGVSCKHKDIPKDKQVEKLFEGISSGEVETGRGYQDMPLRRAGDPRWGSHYDTLLSLISLFSLVLDVLEFVAEKGTLNEQRGKANMLLEAMQCFEFALLLHSLKNVLGITNPLSLALQRMDKDIVNAMELVSVSKKRLQIMRDSGWEPLLNEVSLFCNEYDIGIPNMEEKFVARGRSRCKAEEVTNLHYYCYELFYGMIDLLLQELNNRFNERNIELLLCMACLNPINAFSAFDKEKLIQFAKFYPLDFSPIELMELDNELQSYILDVSSNVKFLEVVGIGELAQKMVETGKHSVYPLVYLVLKLALILPVATATVERVFSAMNIVKTSLCSRLGDSLIKDFLVTYIERDILSTIDNEAIAQQFINLKNRRGTL